MITNDFWQSSRAAVAIDKTRGYFVSDLIDSEPTNVIGTTMQLADQYSYAAPNNFTLSSPLPTIVLPDGAALCIKYRIDTEVFRYKLVDTTDNLYVPLYAGEIIKKNFLIEVWCNGAVEIPEVTFPTSVLQSKSLLTDSSTFELVIGTLFAHAGGDINRFALPSAFVGGSKVIATLPANSSGPDNS